MRNVSFRPSLDALEGRAVLSTTNPLVTPPPPDIIYVPNIMYDPDVAEELMIQRSILKSTVDGLREMWEAERRAGKTYTPPMAVPPVTAGAPPVDPGWWQAITDAMKAAIDAQIPLVHP
jgi:hypothetical protein